MSSNNKNKVLEVKDLKISFTTDNGLVQAVRGVSFDLMEGETLCIVGESGSGKSVTSKTIMGILANNAVVENGTIMYEGENLLEISEDEFHRIRGKKIGMIFQDPLSSLNPIVKIGPQITEAMLVSSDKLRRMYDELIANALVAYRNAQAQADIQLKRAKFVYKSRQQEIAKDEAMSKTQKQKAYASAKAEYKQTAADINKRLKETLPGLKAQLEDRKKFAKAEVKKHKISVEAKYRKELDELNAKLGQVDPKADQVLIEQYKRDVQAEYQQKLAALNDKLAKASTPDEKNAAGSEIKKCKAEEKAKLKMASTVSQKAIIKQEIKNKKTQLENEFRITKAEAKRRALEIMKEVGIPYPERRFNQYPFEFSGGMRQRIVIAIALIAAPDILICDEPTTALDVTIQAQILELINKIKRERKLSCIFITHDLGVVANMADRVAVMYAGKIVEYGTAEEVFFDPKHPYTWALLSSIPDVDSKERLDAIPGTPPNMIYPPKGDAFALRSKYAMKIDFEQEPPYFKISDTHYAATWLLHENAPKVVMPRIVSERIKNALSEGK